MDKKKQVKRIFDTIAYRYDLLNHLLSAGVDIYWRWRAIKLTRFASDARLLDVACGTGDFAIEAARQGVKNITGADLSIEMMKPFADKYPKIKGHCVQMAAEIPPFRNGSFTNITVAFGVRNFYDIPGAFEAFRNILTEGGKLTILEFRLPKNRLMKFAYEFYFNNILPLIGRLISKDQEAYKYLPESVNEFDKKVDLRELLKNAGYSDVKVHALTAGIVQVVIGTK